MSNMTQHDTTPARMTGLSFHGVRAQHISAEVRTFSTFATVEIHISGQSITLFTKDTYEAYAILRNIANGGVRDEDVIVDDWQDEEPF
jgi:hypothetical protein